MQAGGDNESFHGGFAEGLQRLQPVQTLDQDIAVVSAADLDRRPLPVFQDALSQGFHLVRIQLPASLCRYIDFSYLDRDAFQFPILLSDRTRAHSMLSARA